MPDLPRRRRPERPSWTRPIVQRLTPAVKGLVVADALLFLLYILSDAAQPWMKEHLALGPSFISRLELWQPLTSLFLHFNPVWFVFTMIGLWSVGSSLERTQGTRRFLVLFLASGILGNIATGLVSAAQRTSAVYVGPSTAVLAIFVAFGRIHGREMTQVVGGLVLQARQMVLAFVALAVVLGVIQGFSSGDWGGLAGTLVAVAVGYLAAAPGGLRELYDSIRVRRLRRRYRVLEGGAPRRGRSSKYWN